MFSLVPRWALEKDASRSLNRAGTVDHLGIHRKLRGNSIKDGVLITGSSMGVTGSSAGTLANRSWIPLIKLFDQVA